ncbi:MAG: nucleoside phosphorylase [Clostridiales bacterium]|nr:nucleoside phosphorylase [Clostridiales bacterium]
MIKFIDEEGIISPVKRDLGATVAVTTFSDHLFGELVKKYGLKQFDVIPGGIEVPVYEFEVDGKRLVAYQSPVGAPAAVGALEEVAGGSVKSVVAFGICGALADIPTRRLVVPDRAFRDEGTSYHYAPPSDFIELCGSETVAKHLEGCGLKYVKGGAWTTDGFYRETRSRMDYMRANGCIAVDMECAALQAVCNFRGYDFYTFFITADSLAGDEWEPNYILAPGATDVETLAASAAVELAKKLC